MEFITIKLTEYEYDMFLEAMRELDEDIEQEFAEDLLIASLQDLTLKNNKKKKGVKNEFQKR